MTILYRWLLGGAVIVLLGLGFLIGRWIYYHPTKPNTAADYFKDKSFKTDTQYIPSTILHDTSWIPKPYGVNLPPKVVIQYRDTGSAHYFVTHDSLFFGQKGKNTFLNTTFNQYPRLIYGEFSQDSISLTTQLEDSLPNTRQYIVNYSKYKYQFRNNSFNVQELKTTKNNNIAQSKNFFRYDGTYINSGYEMSGKHYSAGAQTGINLGNFRINGSVGLPLNQPSTKPLYEVKVGYKLF